MTDKKHSAIPEDIYREHMLELYRSPENLGYLQNPSHEATEQNTFCGDEITIQANVEHGVVKDVKFSGSGCVISIVASSLLTDKVKGMKVDEIGKMNKDDILELLNSKVTPARIKCALLPLEAMKKALEEK